jgi:hypothetical protein
MKQLTVRLVIPLTIISFILVTKCWYALIIDGTDEFLYGFPMVYTCKAFHTSMAIQFFVLEFVVDLLVYFSFWFVLVYLVHKYVFEIKLKKLIKIALLTILIVLLAFVILMMNGREKSFYLKRDFDVEIIDTDYIFIWQYQERSNYKKDNE